MIAVQNSITRKLTHFDYYTSSQELNGSEAKDFIECLCRDAIDSENTLEDFCADMGYDPKNTDDIATYQACKKIASQLGYLDIDYNNYEAIFEEAEPVLINPSPSQQDEDYYATI